MKRKRMIFFAGGIAALGLLALAAVWGCGRYVGAVSSPYILDDIDEAPVCDAVLVLGAKVYEDGSPSPSLSDRLDRAIELYQAGKAPKIIASGDHGTEEYDEVNGMLDYLLAHGIPREDIFLDHAGFNTYDSLYRARDIFCVKSLLISTQDFHIGRSVYMGRRLGLDAWGVPTPDRESYRLYNQLRESLARVKAVLETDVLRRQPRYLGDAIPIWGDGSVTDG